MASFGTSGNRSLAGRGPAYGFRFFVYAVVSIVLMFYDQRGGWLETVRSGLSAAAYPLQLAVNSPSAAWRWTRANFADRERLQAENEQLREELRIAQLRALRFEALEGENAKLRGLSSQLPPLIDKTLAGEVVDVELSALRQRLLINRGIANGVAKRQAVITGDGILGQALRVGPWSSEIILITDSEHALPVQVQRSGLRTIAVGIGKADILSLPYVPLNSDVREGDILISSGLGGVFPYGIPAAKITEIKRDPSQSLAQITAAPLARIDADRQVLFVWFTPGHPAAPTTADSVGNPVLQPTAASIPAPTQPAAATAATADTAQPMGVVPAAASRAPMGAAPRAAQRRTSAPAADAAPPPAATESTTPAAETAPTEPVPVPIEPSTVPPPPQELQR
jgi:rod shape-determining protein MreC